MGRRRIVEGMRTSTTHRRPGTDNPAARPYDDSGPQALRVLAPVMASVAMCLPVSRTLWLGLVSEPDGKERPADATGARA